MIGLQEYIAYFKNFATQHEDIAHEEETGKEAFVRSNVEELLTGLRTKLHTRGYIMRLFTPEWTIEDNKSANAMKSMRCSLIISGYAPTDDFDKEHEAMDKSEAIIEQIINRMKKDSQNETLDENAIFYKSLRTLNKIDVYPQQGTDENHHGYMLTFTITPFYNPCVDNTQWKDLT